MNIKIILLTLTIFFAFIGYAQPEQLMVDRTLKASNFSVPSSGAFDLLGVSPSSVHRPGSTRDFKLDWVITGNGLNPNIAIEIEPFWLFVNRYKSYNEFVEGNFIEKTLSTLNVSVGTATIENNQSLAYSFKVNLYASKNAMLDKELIEKIAPTFSKADSLYARLLVELEFTDDAERKAELLVLKDRFENQLAFEQQEFETKIQETVANWEQKNWNATMLDAGFGQIFNYDVNVLDTTLYFNSKGNAVWLAGVTGLGKNIMFNAMYRRIKFNDNTIKEVGGNFRYGSAKANIFAEMVYQKSDFKNYQIAYGVDYKLNNNLVIQASLKTNYNNEFELKKLIPTIDFNYDFQ